jgi:hypothetical protein
VLRAAREAETTRENIQDWLELAEGSEFQLLPEEEIAAVLFFFSTLISITFVTTQSLIY